MDESYTHVDHQRKVQRLSREVVHFIQWGACYNRPCHHKVWPSSEWLFREDEGIPKRKGWFHQPDGREENRISRRRARASSVENGSGSGCSSSSTSHVGPCRLVINVEPRCKMFFVSGDKTHGADYHMKIYADMFRTWVERCLVPAFKARYEEQKMILILDDAVTMVRLMIERVHYKRPKLTAQLRFERWAYRPSKLREKVEGSSIMCQQMGNLLPNGTLSRRTQGSNSPQDEGARTRSASHSSGKVI